VKKTPIFVIVARLKRLSLPHQIAHLRSLLKSELPYSIRRNELESLLKGKVTKQLRREDKAA
jgi:hypothetical protein